MKRSLVAVVLFAAACSKNTESKPSESALPPVASGGGGAPTAGSPADPGAANPHGGAANPHGGAADPHGGAPAADPHGGMTGAPSGGAAGGAQPMTADRIKAFTGFQIKVPEGWQEKATKGGMRAAEMTIPGDGGKDAELVIYYFGTGGAGGVDANLERWYGQFEQPDKSSSKDKAKREEKTVDGLKVTLVKVNGTYIAAMQPGAADKHNEPGWGMLAAIIETDAGPYYFKLIGPDKTLAASDKAFNLMIDSIKKVSAPQ